MNAANENEPSEIEAACCLGMRRERSAIATRSAWKRRSPAIPSLPAATNWCARSSAQTIHLNETLGAPSARAMAGAVRQDRRRAGAECRRRRSMSARASANFSPALSPRTLAWSASAAALAILLQAGLIAGILLKEKGRGRLETASAPTTVQRRRRLCADPFPAAGQRRRYHQIPGNQQTQHCGRPVRGRAIPGAHRGDQASEGGSRPHREEAAEDKVVGFIATTE